MAFQPHFDAGFPHGLDQWISAVGSSWATLALLPAQAPRTRKPAIEANASCPPSLESIIELCPFTTFQYFDSGARLNSSVQRMSQFTADASHELRAPVSVIRTTAELAAKGGRSNVEYHEDMVQI